jgi:acyl-CoA thioester hydrolase
MFQTEIQIRVRYSETDRMGYVYYGHYSTYYEVARVEAIRTLGFNYKELEDDYGILLPVRENWSRYISPAYYDDLLTVKVMIADMPNVRFEFQYDIFRENGDKIHTGKTTLVFIVKKSGRPCQAPKELVEHIKPYFE